MKKLLIVTMLLAVVGCTSRYQHQVDQSLLLQENQRLEDALYLTHAQLVDLKRENEALKAMQVGDNGKTSKAVAPAARPKKVEPTPRDDYDEAPKYEGPNVIIPDDAPSSDKLPDSLKSLRIMPPGRSYSSQKTSGAEHAEEIIIPVLPGGNNGDSATPAWSPTRN